MITKRVAAKVKAIKKWAYANYNKSYGAQCIIECFSDTDLNEQFDTLRDAKSWALLMDNERA
jgi:hypothetical protein